MQKILHTPETNVYPDSLVVAPYPLGGNPANTSSRFQATANQANVSILAVQAVGTGRRAIIDLCHGATNKRNFDASCRVDADEVWRYAASYQRLIGWGDSRAATNIMRIQQETSIFERVLLRDGINFRPRNRLRGVAEFFLYQAFGERDLPPSPAHDVPPPSDCSTADKFNTFVGMMAEVANYSGMLADDGSEVAAIDLARGHSRLPMHVVGVTHSFTGPEQVARQSLEGLQRLRQAVDMSLGQRPAELRTSMIEGGHSALLRPGLAAKHIGHTLALQSVST